MVVPFRRLCFKWKSRKNAYSCGLSQSLFCIISPFLLKSNLCFVIQFAPYQRILSRIFPASLSNSSRPSHERPAEAGYQVQLLWFLLPRSARVTQVCPKRDAHTEGALAPALSSAIKTSILPRGSRERRENIYLCPLIRFGGRASTGEMRPGPDGRFVVHRRDTFCPSRIWYKADWR